MTGSATTDNHRLKVLRTLFKSATHNASVTMGRWTGGRVNLTLDEVREIALEDVYTELDVGDDLLTVLNHSVTTLEGDLAGIMVLAFDEANGHRLASMLLGTEDAEVECSGEWTDEERSALCETGNILSCAYMNALADLTDSTLSPSPPDFTQDFGASILEQALMAQAISTDTLLICRTAFHHETKTLNWHVYFVPTEAMRKKMEDTICSAESNDATPQGLAT